jgi:enamine deaminase RidA (YjgF/YER057c/UK114 family)
MTDRSPIIPPGQSMSYERFHFAPAYRVGNTIYVSGVIGRTPDGSVPADPATEFAAAFAQLSTTLEHAGASMADIVDLTTFHTDMPHTLGIFMRAKDAAVAAPYPAWTAIGCSALAAPGARLEIKAVAVVPDVNQ